MQIWNTGIYPDKFQINLQHNSHQNPLALFNDPIPRMYKHWVNTN